jgi:orotidine-5'-phosphate decarboxylase
MVPDPLIIALDVESAAEAHALVHRLGERASFYKVGMELYAAAGMPIVRELLDRGKRVFLDLKFYDIAETVKRATAQVAKSGVQFLTVHGSPSVMRAAIEGRGGSALKILGVTVLTSSNDKDLRDEGYERSVQELVSLRVRAALAAHVDGVIASPLEAVSIRGQAGPDLLLVTPGVRSRGAAAGDQKRVATPEEALRDGADYLVIGRQVTRASDPAAAIAAIRDEIRLAQPART